MELRGCSYLHYIRTIKGGVVENFMNVGRNGKPKPVFKSMEEICPGVDFESPLSLAVRQLKEDLDESLVECNIDETSALSFPFGEGEKLARSCEMEWNIDGSQVEGDDLSFVGTMTLKQLKEKCKTRTSKRKRLNFDFIQVNDEAYYPVKVEGCVVQLEDDDGLDFGQSLNVFKSNLRKKKNRASLGISSASPDASPIKVEETSSVEDDMRIGCIESPIKVKDEIVELDCLDIANEIRVPGLGCNEEKIYPEVILGEVISSELDIQNLEITPITDSLDDANDSCTAEVSSIIEDEEVGCPEARTSELQETSGDYLSTAEEINEGGLEEVPFVQAVISGSDISDFSITEMEPVNLIDGGLRGFQASNLAVSECNDFELSMQNKMSCNGQLPDMTIATIVQRDQATQEQSFMVFQCKSEDDSVLNTDASVISTLNDECNSSWNDNTCHIPDQNLGSADENSPTTDDKQSSVSICGNTEIQLPDAIDGSKMDMNETHQHLEVQHPPERLLSTRKAISPTSQEKLCKAMAGVELQNDRGDNKCHKKLLFRKPAQSVEPSGVKEVEDPGRVIKSENSICQRKTVKKVSNYFKGPHHRGILRAGHRSRSSAGCTSLHSCSQSAIAFSQRQLRDIESLTLKLTNELKSLKGIVEETLRSGACSPTPLKHIEWRDAIDNTTAVEETTRKWLSIMSRDCTRFCKIMELNEKVTENSEYTTQKERKKIVFADEAGEKLCHVKVFEYAPSSVDDLQ